MWTQKSQTHRYSAESGNICQLINPLSFCPMLKATKVRLYPTKEQQKFLCGQFGAVRFCYNTIHCCFPPSPNHRRPPSARPLLPLKIKAPSILKKELFVKILRYTVIAVLLAALGVGLMQVAQYVGDRTTGPHHFAVNPLSSQIPR